MHDSRAPDFANGHSTQQPLQRVPGGIGARVTATRSRPNPAGHLEPFAKVRRSLLLDRFCASFATLLCRPTIMMDTVQADAEIRATLRAGLTPSGLS
jgi:hypothetical protein